MQYGLSGIFFLSVEYDDGYPRWQKGNKSISSADLSANVSAKLYYLEIQLYWLDISKREEESIWASCKYKTINIARD